MGALQNLRFHLQLLQHLRAVYRVSVRTRSRSRARSQIQHFASFFFQFCSDLILRFLFDSYDLIVHQSIFGL